MKNIYNFLIVITFTFSLINIYANNNGGGEFKFNEKNVPCLTEEQIQIIIKQNNESIKHLKSIGVIDESLNKGTSSFGWPIKAANHNNDFGVYGISNFVDLDPNYPNQLLDYNGGRRTYDLSNGYNHQGTDIFTWPFSWNKMDNDDVEIVAVDDGTIINKFDGNYDRNCDFSNGSWNAVYVRHTNGEVVWYGHMKKNSLTNKGVGQTVSKGEYLGVVGSSGSSTGPHLHIEIYDNNNNLIDPWFGSSNQTVTSSWWENQPAYYDSKINKIATHTSAPEFQGCPQPTITYLKNVFNPGNSVYFATYYQDQVRGQVSEFTITTPENIVWQNWTHTFNQADHYSASYWYWSFNLPTNASLGTWKFTVFYEDGIYNHNFIVSDNTTSIDDIQTLEYSYTLGQNYPNPFNPSTVINFSVPKETNVKINLYNSLGEKIETIVNRVYNTGNHSVNFDASNLRSGVYLYTLEAGDYYMSKKMTLIK